MPFSYRFDAARRLVLVGYAEPCTGADVLAYLLALPREPWFPQARGVLVDVRGIGYTPTYREAEQFAALMANPLTYARRPWAVVVGSTAHYGVGRQVGALAEAHGGRVQVFTSREDAEGWLAGAPPAAG